MQKDELLSHEQQEIARATAALDMAQQVVDKMAEREMRLEHDILILRILYLTLGFSIGLLAGWTAAIYWW
jgi:hypothetical protein